MRRLWIATAPPGVWSSGPAVLYDDGDRFTAEAITAYRVMGWEVTGPWLLEADLL